MSSSAITSQYTKLGIQSVTGSVSVEFDATAATIERATGDWTTDYAVGMIVTTSDVDNPGPYVITTLTSTIMTVAGQTKGYPGTSGFKIVAPAVLTTDATPASFTITGYLRVGEMNNFEGPGGEAGEVDVTNMDSTAREFRAALVDNGEVSFDVNFLRGDAGQKAFRAAQASGELQSFILMLSDATATQTAWSCTFEGFAKNMRPTGEADGKVTASASIRVSGAAIWTGEE